MMIELNSFDEVTLESSANALIAMGENLIKEASYPGYNLFMEDDESHISGFRKVLDFLSRCIMKFTAWIKKGQIKKAKELLEKSTKVNRLNNNYGETEDGRVLYTFFWDYQWFEKAVVKPLVSLHKLPVAKMIESGAVKDFDRSSIAAKGKQLERLKNRLATIEGELTPKNKVHAINVSHSGDHSVAAINKYLDFCSGKVYDDMMKALESIVIVKRHEKERGSDDSSRVSDQYAHTMTLLANCYMYELKIALKVANMVLAGSLVRLPKKTGKHSEFKDLTLQELFDTMKEIYNENPYAKQYGIGVVPVKTEDGRYRVTFFYITNDANNMTTKWIACQSITDNVKRFIEKSNGEFLKEADLR